MSLRFKWHTMRRIASDPRYLPFFLQRRVRNPKQRNKLADMIALRRPQKAWTAHVDPSVAAALATDGIGMLGTLLQPEQLTDIRSYLKGKLVADPYLIGSPPFYPGANDRPALTHVAYHDAADVLAAPHLLALANRPELLALAESFLGCKPTIGYLAAWWSYAANDGAQAAENFHRDVDDLRFLKLFVYLTDVAADQGPHVYVRGSARSKQLSSIRRFSDSEVEAAFGRDAITTIAGKAGDAFLENTFGLHKGTPVQQAYRLIFQVVYTLSPLPYAPRHPIGKRSDYERLASATLDPFVNRLYLEEQA